MKKYLVKCPDCSEMVNKYALQGHILKHKKIKERAEKSNPAENESLNDTSILENQPSSKRKAAQK